MPVARRPILERLWPKVDRSGGLEACWPWTGSRLPKGYGQIRSGGKHGRPLYPHRVILAAALGRELEPDELAMHACDNPPCCNPLHLAAGSASDNMRQMVAHDRHAAHMRRRTG